MMSFIRFLSRDTTLLVMVTGVPALGVLAALLGRRRVRPWIPLTAAAVLPAFYFAALAGLSRGKMAVLGETVTGYVLLFLVVVGPITAAVLVAALSRFSVRARDRMKEIVSPGRAAAAIAGYILCLVGLVWLSDCLNWGNETYRAGCMNNVRQIGLAALNYAHDHEGHSPASFGVLLKEGYLNTASVFICPSGLNEVPSSFPTDFKAARLEDLDTAEDWGDYVQVKGLDLPGEGDVVVIYEKDGAHEGEGRNVFFADGHTQWQNEHAFGKRMAKQPARLRDMK